MINGPSLNETALTTNASIPGLDADIDEDGNPDEPMFDAAGAFEFDDAPEWLRRFAERKPHLLGVIGAPILVSTIDYLIAAGEPQRQAHHALAGLRMMSSDLILDEIDSYEPLAPIAVLRLIVMAGLHGRNVVVSSATLAQPVAVAVWRAFAFGCALGSTLRGEVPARQFNVAFLNDLIAPVVGRHADEAAFAAAYFAYGTSLSGALAPTSAPARPRYRVPELLPVDEAKPADWFSVIRQAAEAMHDRHGWRDEVSGKRLSFGLVRVANIGVAIRVAETLAGALPHARVACYHSGHFALQRYHIELRLDQFLTRKHGDGMAHILQDPDIRKILRGHSGPDIPLIVVATPVEEIGRDHDFDWAVIEPSSAQSIVQTAGRVNRHRLADIDPTAPNVGILQFNRKHILRKALAFTRPGLETADHPYSSHDLGDLLNWSRLDAIDARLRFDHSAHPLAAQDDASINRAISRPLARIFGNDNRGNLWMSLDTYVEAPLRDHDGIRLELTLQPNQDNTFSVVDDLIGAIGDRIIAPALPRVTNDWLSLDDTELGELAADLGVDANQGLTVALTSPSRDGDDVMNKVRRHRSFGFWLAATR